MGGSFMAEKTPAPASSTTPRLLIGALAIALVGAGFWIVQLEGRVNELEARVAAAPAPAPTRAPVAPQAATAAAARPTISPADILTEAQRQSILQVLSSESEGKHQAWMHIQSGNADSVAAATAFQQLFEQAGWSVEIVRVPYPVKAGLFLLAGDTEPPAHVTKVNEAIDAAGLQMQYLTGYRDFVAERKRTNPQWVGPELADDQVFTLIIGGRPTLK